MRKELLHNGHFANAVVWKEELPDGRCAVRKDFSQRSWIVKNTIGRFLVRREVAFMQAVESTEICPGGITRSSPFSLTEDFCQGVTFRQIVRALYEGENAVDVPDFLRPLLSRPDVSFFRTLEEKILTIHKMGIVHLDLHNARNMMRLQGDKAVILDWQSAMRTNGAFLPFRRLMERIDLSGLYKHWEKICPDTMGHERHKVLEWFKKTRKFWVLRGIAINSRMPENTETE